MSVSYVLDACALIALLKDEPGAAVVEDAAERAENIDFLWIR